MWGEGDEKSRTTRTVKIRHTQKRREARGPQRGRQLVVGMGWVVWRKEKRTAGPGAEVGLR